MRKRSFNSRLRNRLNSGAWESLAAWPLLISVRMPSLKPVPNGASQANDGAGSSHTGRPTREESGEIPPKVRAALTLRAAGHSWKQCSDMTGASYRNLLKWKDLPIAEAYVEEKVKEALAGTYNKLISAGPAVADRLLSIALNPETKSYAAVSACEAVIRSIERGVLDREMREHITKLREQMAQLEHGRPIDV